MDRVEMTRMTFHITEGQRAWLREETKRLGITVPELLRRLLDSERMKAWVDFNRGVLPK